MASKSRGRPSAVAAAKKHVEEIRRTKFSIGGKSNPLTADLHQAVKNLSAELYAKDVHFLMELIQNAEDNEYPNGVDPSLEFVITSKDITNTGAPATLLVFNNEKGFSRANIDSICSVGHSTKKGLRAKGYIGEKGIGFKSVFLITAQPYIFSNGYQIRFDEKPCKHCNVGYIVPEWVDKDPTLAVIKSVYGSANSLPTTTLVLPLKADKVKPVQDHLSVIHPELLLFLSKIKRLSVRENNEDPSLNSINAISISSEINFSSSKSMDADSYTLYLTADADDIANDVDRECGYYMWKQRFPVKQENKVDVRMDVDEWVITLAFPIEKRLKRGASFSGIYSFLPTETVTGFPFIIQADFLLASSRESILWDNRWNQGILGCVPVAFVNAFTSLVKSTVNAPISSLPHMFRFLPAFRHSAHTELNYVQYMIHQRIMGEAIVPCESYTGQRLFRKPSEVRRLKPEFWSILNSASSQGVNFSNISSHGAYLLASSFDKDEYKAILDYLRIKPVVSDWYARCIGGSNLVMGVSEDVYLQLLIFIAENWESFSQNTNMNNIPIMKYVGRDDYVDVFNLNDCTNKLLATDSDKVLWLISWNAEFHRSTGFFFLPKCTQDAIRSCLKKDILKRWLKDVVKVKFISVSEYAELVIPSLYHDSKLTVAYAHFVYNTLHNRYLLKEEVKKLCKKMPIVDNYGQVVVERRGVLVPANGSNWVELVGSNVWWEHNYVELGEIYNRPRVGMHTSVQDLMSFLRTFVGACDIPDLLPPTIAIPTLSSPLTKRNTFLLLNWLKNLRTKGASLPGCFLSSIKEGSWMRVSLSGSSGYRPPSESFMLEHSKGHLLQNGLAFVDIPLVDTSFYGDEIKQYKVELQEIGVRFENRDACEFIGKRLMSLAASSKLTKDNVFAILKFIRYLWVNGLSSHDFVNSIKEGKWLKTSQGDMNPGNSVLFSNQWNAASQISDIPFIDQDYYGRKILSFKKELGLVGVFVNFGESSYQLVSDYLKSSSSFNSLSNDAFYFVLKCIKQLQYSDKLVWTLKNSNCLKTNLGFKCSSECFLVDPESDWGCLLQVFRSFPVLDERFYGSCIYLMSEELKKIGVKVDFEDVSKEFTCTFKQHASSFSMTKENVFSFLLCYRNLKKKKVKLPTELKNCIHKEKWLRTKLGDYRSPNECIVYNPDWEAVSQVSLLPFIDDSSNFYGSRIHDYKAELKQLGAVTDFKDGARFVASGLFLPQDSSDITPVNVYALLRSIKKLKETQTEIPVKFLETLSQKNWIKTHFGYKRPDECLLFSSSWDPFLKCSDGPFLDEDFYGSGIQSYKEELSFLGVISDINKGCHLLGSYLDFHSNIETINRIYSYLSEFKWKPVDEENKKIWIPGGPDYGEWVAPDACVLHDKKNLFGGELNVLDKFKYEKKLLVFFADVFHVRAHPSVDDYCKLWKKWESSERQITHIECCGFWDFVVKNWNSKTEETFIKNLSKLPVLDPTSDGIFLVEKCDVFIGDDLFLMDLVQSSSRPMFVWYPQPTPKSLTRTKLVDIYTKLGVRTLSASVQKNTSEVDHVGLKPVNSKGKIIKRGLFKLILAFLADPNLEFDIERRHKAVSRLLTIETFETEEPMSVKYSLSFSSGDVINVEAKRMIRWDKQNSKFFMQKMENFHAHKNVVEYASHFAEVIADGVLWENEELVPKLSELIRLGFLVDFDEETIEFIMKDKNLQIFREDEDYLSSTFSSDSSRGNQSAGRVYKRQRK